MKCANGHPMVTTSLREERQCAGCGEKTATVYDCKFKCFGQCPACAKKVTAFVPAPDPPPDGES